MSAATSLIHDCSVQRLDRARHCTNVAVTGWGIHQQGQPAACIEVAASPSSQGNTSGAQQVGHYMCTDGHQDVPACGQVPVSPDQSTRCNRCLECQWVMRVGCAKPDRCGQQHHGSQLRVAVDQTLESNAPATGTMSSRGSGKGCMERCTVRLDSCSGQTLTPCKFKGAGWLEAPG
jgi:hypothetical protein